MSPPLTADSSVRDAEGREKMADELNGATRDAINAQANGQEEEGGEEGEEGEVREVIAAEDNGTTDAPSGNEELLAPECEVLFCVL